MVNRNVLHFFMFPRSIHFIHYIRLKYGWKTGNNLRYNDSAVKGLQKKLTLINNRSVIKSKI